ncbi:hypothetical protein ACJMK2_009374, partial [Sinanodonta woodiana]
MNIKNFLSFLPMTYIQYICGIPCTDKGEIQVMNDQITQYKSLYARESDKPCNVNRTAGEVKFIIYGCNVMMSIKVTLMEEDQETMGQDIVFGGKGVAGYDLQCTGVPIGGSITILQATLQVGETGFEYTDQHQASLLLSMEIKEHDTLRTTSSPVKVGTPLNVTISGSDHFRFYAKSCRAEGPLGQVKYLIQEGKSVDASIITDFSDLTPVTLGRMQTETLLYAFHFIGSDDITLNCTVFACRHEDSKCKTTIPHDSISKRAANEGNGTRMNYVRAGIRVIDEYYYPISSGRKL